MNDWYIAYYDNRHQKMRSVTYKNVTKKEAIDKFNNFVDYSCILVNIIEL